MTLVSGRVAGSIFFASLLAVAGAQSLPAQGNKGVDARWQAWLGCWQRSEAPVDARSLLVCVVPASGSSAVNVVTIADGKEVTRERLQATGARLPIAKYGCDGWETTRWSADSRRVYLRSELTCVGGLQRTSIGVLAFSSTGEWLDIQGVIAAGAPSLRGIRYRDAGIPPGVPAEIAAALTGRQVAISAARATAGARIGLADVVDASRNVDPGVVQGWLVARGQPFQLDAAQLASLADAGVPGSVTDVMLALTYPNVLALELGAVDGQLLSPTDSALAADAYQPAGRATQVYTGRNGYPSFGYSPFDWGYSGYGYSPYGYSPYAYGSYGNRAPYIIVTKASSATTPRGRAEKGRGYTRGDHSTGSGKTSVTPTQGSSGAGTGRGSPGSTGRTAKPRR